MSNSFERPSWDEYFMLQAELAKLRSNCMTRHVGASARYGATRGGLAGLSGGCRLVETRSLGTGNKVRFGRRRRRDHSRVRTKWRH